MNFNVIIGFVIFFAIFLGWPTLFVSILLISYLNNRKRSKNWSDFAANNEMVFLSDATERESIFKSNIKNFVSETKMGDMKIKRAIVNKDYKENPGTSGMYTVQITVGQGKNSRVYVTTVANFPVTATSENVYIVSQLVKSEGMIRNSVSGDQKYMAEGDLAKYLCFYMPDGEKVDSMQIFDPNVMSFILENLANCDIELKDDQLYLYIQRPVSKPQEIDKILQRGKKLAEMIEKASPESKFDNLPHAGEEKAKLKKANANLAVMIVTIIISLYLIFRFTAFSLDDKLILLSFPIVCALVLFALISILVNGTKKSRLRKEYTSRYGREALI